MCADTLFAPAERVAREIALEDARSLLTLENINDILNSLPYIAAILNEHRQILFSNQAMLDLLGISSGDILVGKRPGEAFQCIHSDEHEGGCGTAEACRYCGAVQVILESQKTGKRASNECRITSRINGVLVPFDLQITAMPFRCASRTFTLVTIIDISAEKRRLTLESVFFHDIINTAGGLSGLIDVLEDCKDEAEMRQLFTHMGKLSARLIEEVLAQRDLTAAESGNLCPRPAPIKSRELLEEAIAQIKYHKSAEGKTMVIEDSTCMTTFTSDSILLRRCIVNIVKNALEATPAGGVVQATCCADETSVTFSIRNPGIIPRDIQLQLFQRSFSTKGIGRGLGSYSAKLIVENYLKGQVGFTSVETKGTTFFIRLPRSIPETA